MNISSLEHLPEDERIDAIVDLILEGDIVGVAMEKKKVRKIARYIRKIIEQCPGAAVLEQIETEEGAVIIKFRPPLNS